MEKLTGKCKEDLLNFYWDNYIGKTRFLEQKSDPYYDMSGTYRANIEHFGFQSMHRNEATNSAITKANELYNSKQ